MADSLRDDKGGSSRTEVIGANEASNTSTTSVMDVDPPTETQSTKSFDASESLNGNEEEKVEKSASDDKAEESEFLVLEEDDGGEEEEQEDRGNKNTGKINETFNTPEPEPMDAASTAPEAQENPDDSTFSKDDEPKNDDVLLVNPLFGKDNASVPVINIESSSSSSDDDDEEEDFSLDVKVNNFQQASNDAEILLNGDGTEGSGKSPPQEHKRTNRKSCNCDCYHEKGILVNEIERLRRAVFEINERHSVLEDFIEVEYSESFDKFLKNREHLVSMGFGGKDSEGSDDIIDGKRSSRSAELIELLKMIKEQATANVKEESAETSATKKPSTSKGGGSFVNQSNKHQQKAKPIPSVVGSQRDRGSGRGGALSYSQRPVFVQNTPSNVQAMNYQYQQQFLAQEAQARQYYQSMYGHTGQVRDGRDFITAVGRTDLYPASSSYGYGYGGRPDGNVSNKESKKQRKRKRQSEVSSEASSSSKNIPNSGKNQQSGSSIKKNTEPDDDIAVVDYNQDLNVSTKRICPLCEKIINRKGLRDHLSIVHQGHKVACPVCQAEFMNRKRIKTHMRDSHDLPISEYSAYINKIYSNIEEQCGPWLDKLMQEAETPTKDQLLVHNAEIQLAMIAKRDQNAASASTGEEPTAAGSSTMKAPPPSRPSGSSSSSRNAPLSSSTASGGRKDNRDRDRDPRNRGSRGGASSSQPVRYFTGANSKVSGSKGHGGSHGYGDGRMDVSSAELYGPGGYAQYAARYLQQRAATGSNGAVSRIYTPF